jgi:hypothetical protein
MEKKHMEPKAMVVILVKPAQLTPLNQVQKKDNLNINRQRIYQPKKQGYVKFSDVL